MSRVIEEVVACFLVLSRNRDNSVWLIFSLTLKCLLLIRYLYIIIIHTTKVYKVIDLQSDKDNFPMHLFMEYGLHI